MKRNVVKLVSSTSLINGRSVALMRVRVQSVLCGLPMTA